MSLLSLSAKRLGLTIALSALLLTACAPSQSASSTVQSTTDSPAAIANEITVFRSPTCGCCGKWIEHAKAAGFSVKDEITEDMPAIKQQYGVPQELASCHTTLAGSYIIEGHVPLADVEKLLTEQPDVAGIAVPGMPIGSPGMESGDYVEPYTVFSFTPSGRVAAFSEHS